MSRKVLVLIQADQTPVHASEQTLQEAGLGKAESWGVSSEVDEYLRASIDPKWSGDMPRTLLIAPNGDVTRMRGVADLDEVNRWLDSVTRKK